MVHAGAVTKASAGFEDWVHPGVNGVCAPCHWGRTEPSLRQSSWLVTDLPSAVATDRSGLAPVLRHAVPPGSALAVVLRARRKHVLPAARWGMVAVDDVPVRWGDREGRLFRAVESLLDVGVTRSEMLQAAPPFRVLRDTAADQWAPIQRLWEQVEPWRRPDSPWMTVALFACTSRTSA